MFVKTIAKEDISLKIKELIMSGTGSLGAGLDGCFKWICIITIIITAAYLIFM